MKTPPIQSIPHYGGFKASAAGYRKAGIQIVHGFCDHSGHRASRPATADWRPYIAWENGTMLGSTFTPDQLEELGHLLIHAANQARSFKPDRRLKRQDRYCREYVVAAPTPAPVVSPAPVSS
jgi:hypothetical protein